METVNKREIFLPELHEKQIEIVENQSRFKVLSAGRRWGKTLQLPDNSNSGLSGQEEE